MWNCMRNSWIFHSDSTNIGLIADMKSGGEEGLKPHKLCIDRVIIWSELKYLLRAEMIRLKYRVYACKTGPIPMVRVFHVVKPVARVRVWVEPDLQSAHEFGTIANTKRQ